MYEVRWTKVEQQEKKDGDDTETDLNRSKGRMARQHRSARALVVRETKTRRRRS